MSDLHSKDLEPQMSDASEPTTNSADVTNVDNTDKKSKPKKSARFAPPPEELQEHHENLRKKEQEKKKGIPFHQIPPELSYLDRKPGPKPLPSVPKPEPRKSTKVLGDLKLVHVKDFSIANKETEINFNYPTIELPIPNHNVLVSIEYASVNSYDINKLNKYYYNLSDVKVGLGYEFVASVKDVGKTVTDFAPGDKVVGILSPYGRKGSLSTSLLLNPAKDFMVKIDEFTEEKLRSAQVFTQDYEVLQGKFKLEPSVPAAAWACVFPVLFSKAKQALQHLNNLRNPKIIINGGNTNIGYTILQVLLSSLYEFESLHVVLIVKESDIEKTQQFVDSLAGPNKLVADIDIVSYDLVNEDIVLPGEKVPINYKKPELMVVDVLEAIFKHTRERVTKQNVDEHKLDLIIDIIGSGFLQKTSIRYKKLDTVSFPVVKTLDADTKISELLQGNVKEPFLVKILKKKAKGSGFVSLCKFSLKEPSYSIDTLIDYNESSLNPWKSRWGSSLGNSLLSYNYYDEIALATSRAWIIEGLNLLLKGEIKFKVDSYFDWRNDLRLHVQRLRKHDGKFLVKLEPF